LASRQAAFTGRIRQPSRWLCWAATLLLIIGFAAPAQAQRNKKALQERAVARAEIMAQTCFPCHGPRGSSVAAAVPNIGGQGAIYLTSALMAFKEGKRPATVMDRIMKGYTEVEIMEIAKYISRQPFVRNEQITDKTKVEVGAKAYRAVCIECHLNGGRESEMADYPLLAGQRLLYMQMEMHQIHATGKRKVDPKFQRMLDKLPKEDIEAVLHFFASQR
jgi:sulfide dehydrogenase cytochrome subunit